MQGILLVDKPASWTSFDVVNYVRRIVANEEGKKPKNCKVGHTGTLDPFATGLLVLLVGKEYTRRAMELSKLDKSYAVTMRLGEVSTTGDPEGEIQPSGDKVPSLENLNQVLMRFRGEIQQVPPAYSAIKIDGQRAYKLARAGKTVTLAARTVKISSLEVSKYTYPDVLFNVTVSSGTYIRSLVEDIGRELGVGAYTTALRRLSVGSYSVNDSVMPESLALTLADRLKSFSND